MPRARQAPKSEVSEPFLPDIADRVHRFVVYESAKHNVQTTNPDDYPESRYKAILIITTASREWRESHESEPPVIDEREILTDVLAEMFGSHAAPHISRPTPLGWRSESAESTR